MKLNKLMLTGLFLVSSGVWAHGFVSSPPSRSDLCNIGTNTACGAIQYEPQSVEGFDGFPATGPADKKIASAEQPSFTELDIQTPARWAKSKINSGENTFKWTFRAPHPMKDFKYYITKQDWDPSVPLTRESFDLTPFCTIDGKGAVPAMGESAAHKCNVPERTGYQVILAVWDVGDTDKAFYNVIDVDFGKGSENQGEEEVADAWQSNVGTISSNESLNAGDQVKLRVFDKSGERTDLATVLKIDTAANGQQNVWPRLLAQKVNAEQSELRAGQKDTNGNINPAFGSNPVYAKENSGLSSVQTEIVKSSDEQTVSTMALSGVQSEYAIHDGKATIEFSVQGTGKLTVEAQAYNHDRVSKGYTNGTVDNNTQHFVMELKDVTAGHHRLVVTAKDESGQSLQQNADFMLTSTDEPSTNAKYDYVFPENLKSYTAGATVFQPKDGKVYQCKPYPYSGYCTQWTQTATQYEPGVGSNWQDAWILK